MKRAIFLALLLSTSISQADCLQGGLPVAFDLGGTFCPLDKVAAKKDVSAIRATIKGMHDRYANDEEADGAGASLYFGYQAKYNQAQETKSVYSVLSPEQMFSVYNYIEWGYQSYNGILWTGENQSPGELSEIRVLTSALNSLPSFEGEVIRGEMEARLNKDEAKLEERVARFKLDKPYLFKGFMSTARSHDESTRDMYVDRRLIVLKIKSKTGKYIAPLSSRPEEEEVLFRPHTNFKVISKEKVPRAKVEEGELDYQYVIGLEEI